MAQPIQRSRNQYGILPVSRCAPVRDLTDPLLPHDEDFRLAEFLDGVHGEGRGMAIAASSMENLSLWKQEECVLVSQFGSPLRALLGRLTRSLFFAIRFFRASRVLAAWVGH